MLQKTVIFLHFAYLYISNVHNTLKTLKLNKSEIINLSENCYLIFLIFMSGARL